MLLFNFLTGDSLSIAQIGELEGEKGFVPAALGPGGTDEGSQEAGGPSPQSPGQRPLRSHGEKVKPGPGDRRGHHGNTSPVTVESLCFRSSPGARIQ